MRITILSDFAVSLLEEFVRYWCDRLGIGAELTIAPRDSIIPQLIGQSLDQSGTDVTVVLVSLDQWCSGQVGDDSFELFGRAVRSTAECRPETVFQVVSCPISGDVCDAEKIASIEDATRSSFANLHNVDFVPSSAFSAWNTDISEFFSEYVVSGESLYTPIFFATVATIIARGLYRRFGEPRKVIVVDCDNTLWSGICGECGPTGVGILEGHKFLQELLLQQSKMGKLVCQCSKNNESDVLAVFRQHPDVVLKLENIVSYRINWKSKGENLKSLSAELSLSLDSFIFIDDDLNECEEVRSLCPSAEVIQLPRNPSDYSKVLERVWDFDNRFCTEEDSHRREYYVQNAKRHREMTQGVSLAEFLRTLRLHVTFEPLADRDLARAAQLSRRVTQFNLNSRKRGETELRRLRQDWLCHVVRVSDRFGDYGLVGVIIFRAEQNALIVETLLLSCRSLGKGVESHIANFILRYSQDLDTVKFHFVPSHRNLPVQEFLTDIGCTLDADDCQTVRKEVLSERLANQHGTF